MAADKKISELTAYTTPIAADEMAIVDTTNGITKKITMTNLKTEVVRIATPVGTVNGVNTSFTVASEPRFVVSDGIMYFSGAGYSYLAGTITMDIAPSSFIRAFL